jgi:hypothetical protein
VSEFQTGIFEMDAETYHKDPCRVPSLSASIGKLLVLESPLDAWRAHPRLGGVPRESTESMDRGALVHAMLLGSGSVVEIVEADSFRAKEAQAQRDAATAAGKVPMIRAKHEALSAEVDALRAKLGKRGIAFSGQCERVIMWPEIATDGTRIQCRAMLDHVDGCLIDELKTIANANPKKLRRVVESMGYDLAWAAYTSGYGAVFQDLAGRIGLRWVFIELEEPHHIVTARPSGSMRALGNARWQTAIDRWARCTRDNRWPDFADERDVMIEASPWELEAAQVAGWDEVA